MQTADQTLFLTLHATAGHSAFVDALIVFCGEYLFYVVMLIFVWLMYRAYLSQRDALEWYIAALAGAVVARLGVTEIIRLFLHRPRPFVALHLPHLLTGTSYSFPSGHAMFMFALAAGIFRSNKKVGVFLFIAGLIVGIARVAAGVHYPSDILGGIVLGSLMGYVAIGLWEWYRRRPIRPNV